MQSNTIQAGDFNRRIVITRATTAKDAMGQPIKTWATYATVWARYDPVSDAEKVMASEVYASLAARFLIRWSLLVSTVDARDQINFDGRVFDIIGAKETLKRTLIEITAGTRGERTP